jgi:thymidylate synthase (FAD)
MPRVINDISVHCLASTKVDRLAVRSWLDELEAVDFVIPPEDQIADPALLVALAAKQCYLAFQPGLNPNVTKVRKDLVEYLDNILSQGHGSVLEHAVYTFGVNNCSRVFTGEMNRHRAGAAISERSMRYIRLDSLGFWMPTLFQPSLYDSTDIRDKKELSRVLLVKAFAQQEQLLAELRDVWHTELDNGSFAIKKQLTSAFRRIIGMGVATGGVWSLNIRALRHVIAMRTSEAAEEEMILVVGKIAKHMIADLPELFSDFIPTEAGSYIPTYEKV